MQDFNHCQPFREGAAEQAPCGSVQPFYLEAGKLGLKEFLTERLQPAPLSPGGGDRITEEGLQKGGKCCFC